MVDEAGVQQSHLPPPDTNLAWVPRKTGGR